MTPHRQTNSDDVLTQSSSVVAGVDDASHMEIVPRDCVLIIGGGPVGLNLATVLAYYGVKSIVLERNETTTRWPKMDLTNVRSMELFRKLGLAQGLRSQGVASHIQCPVLVSSGLSKDRPVTRWLHPSVDQYRLRIASVNDGSMPLEPYQRISQAVFERWLKELCDKNPFIDLRFGCKAESLEEFPGGVKVIATSANNGKKYTLLSRYVAGCDGASSRIRRSLGIPLDGGPVPGYMLLVHFKSRDVSRLHKQGQFWHIFFIGRAGLSGAIIAQNEIDTWTTHLALPLEQDPDEINTYEAVYRVLGGIYEPYKIKIDEVLVRSTYRPNIAVARSYSGTHGHVYLAGDAAHQNIPTGGYGMNMGIADAFDLGWKLAFVINGYGQPGLLRSYEEDRRPVAMVSIERSGVHMAVHMNTAKIIGENADNIDDDSEQGRKLRKAVHEHYQTHDGENMDLGIEMGYRYRSGVTIPDGSTGPEEDPSRYVPSTFPGSRAPHVYLRDGSAIFDHYSKYFSLVEFADGDNSSSDRGAHLLLEAANKQWVPVDHILLEGEDHAHRVWERRLVLVRPDGHVAWRGDLLQSQEEAARVIAKVAGLTDETTSNGDGKADVEGAFSSTAGTFTQRYDFELDKMGDLQR